LAGAAEAGANFAGWIADLPDPIKEIGVELAGVTSATALLTGGFLLAVPQVVALHTTFKGLQTTAPLVAAGLTSVVAAAGGLAALLVLAELNEWADDFVRVDVDLDRLAATLGRVGSEAEFAGEQVEIFARKRMFGLIAEESISGAEALDRFATSAQIAFGDSFWDKAGRLQNTGSLERFIAKTQELDTTLAQLVSSGNTEQASMLFDMFWDTVKDIPGVELDEVMQGFEQYEAAMASAGAVTQETLDIASSFDAATFPDMAGPATDADRLAQEYSELAAETEEAAQAQQDLVDALNGMVDAAFGAQDAAIN